MQLDGAVALVTGSSRGIGREVARRLTDRGAEVVLHGRDPDAVAGTAAQLGAAAVAVDLTAAGAAAELAARARAVHGRIDVLVHSAGIGWAGRFAEMPEQRLADVLTLDLTAPAQLTRAVLPDMLDAGRGHVCVVGSIAGLTARRRGGGLRRGEGRARSPWPTACAWSSRAPASGSRR